MANIKDISAGLTYVKIMVDNKALEKGLQKSESLVKRFGDVCASIGSKMAATGALLSAPFVSAIRVFSDFDDQMRMTKAVTGASAEQFESLTKRARELGRDTAFTASQVASGMTALGRMGFSSKEINQSIASVVDLSLATGTDLAQSADIAANSLRMFKLESSEMSRVADVLTATANGSAQTLGDLFEALKMAGPQASVAKESIEDVAAAIGMMANVGIKGSMAGTALRRAYSQMADGKIRKILDLYNIKTVDANNNLRKMKDIIVDISKAMQEMGTAEKMNFAEQIFGQRGAQVALTLGSDPEGLLEFSRKLQQDIADQAKRTREELEKGIGGAFRNLGSALEAVKIALGSSIGELVTSLLGKFTKIAKAVSEWIDRNGNLVRSLAILAGVLTGVGSVLVAVGLGISGFSGAARMAHSVVAKITSPITEYHAAIAAAAEANMGMASSMKKVTTAVQARIQADGAALAVGHAQRQVTAANTALLNARTPAEHAAARASLNAAQANVAQAVAAEKNAKAQLTSISAAEASAQAFKKLSLAKQHEALAAQAADAARIASAKRVALSEAERVLAQSASNLELAKATGIGVAQAQANFELARSNYNVAASAHSVAQAEVAKKAAMQAALAPQALQLAGAQKLLAAFGLQATASNLACASFLALSNAMAGDAAKTAIVAWVSGLAKINVITGLTAVKNYLAAASVNLLSVAMIKQGLVATGTAVQNFLAASSLAALGIAAKGAVAGVMLLTKALTVLAAHPVIAALAAIMAAMYLFSKKAGKIAGKAHDDAMQAAKGMEAINREFEHKQKTSDQSKSDFDRLLALQKAASEAKLTVKQLQEAESLIARLKQQRFSNADLSAANPLMDALKDESLSVEVKADLAEIERLKTELAALENKTVPVATEADLAEIERLKTELAALEGKTASVEIEVDISDANAALEKFNKKMHESQVQALQTKIQRKMDLASQLKKNADDIKPRWWHVNKNYQYDKLEGIQDKIAEIQQSAQEDLQALRELRDKPRQQQNEAEEQNLRTSVEANADAQKRLAEISRKLADDKLSDIEKEIQGIHELREEYIRLLKSRLAFEEGRSRPNQKAIDELKASLAEADDLFKGMEAAAYESHYKKNRADLGSLSKTRERQRFRADQEGREQAELERMRKGPKGDYLAALNTRLGEAYSKLAGMAGVYDNLFAEFSGDSSDGGKAITEEERKRLEAQKELYDYTEQRIDFLRDKLREADVDVDLETEKQKISQSSLGSFFTADILNLLGGAGPEEETARNTRATVASLATLIDLTRRNEGPAFS